MGTTEPTLDADYVRSVLTPDAVFKYIEVAGKSMYDYTFLRPNEDDKVRIMIQGSNLSHDAIVFNSVIDKDLTWSSTATIKQLRERPLTLLLPYFMSDIDKVFNERMLDGPFMVEHLDIKVVDEPPHMRSRMVIYVTIGLIPCWIT